MTTQFYSPTFWLLVLCAVAMIVPWRSPDSRTVRLPADSIAWPHTLDGRVLSPLGLTAQEQTFLANFPGAVRRFSDGEREVIVRWVKHGTRRLHPAADCYRAMGFHIGSAVIVSTNDINRRCFVARRGTQTWQVCERIESADRSQSWTDVSAWYWSTVFGESAGPWWAITTAEPIDSDRAFRRG